MYYTLEKTAEILDCTPGDVNRLREANKLRAFRDGASWKFRKEDVEKYLTDLIRERSKPAAPSADDLLNDSDDEELPTMLADSASFDAMIDATAETLEIKTNAAPEPDFVLDDASNPSEDDADLQIVAEPQAENDGLALEIESDDLQLVDEAPQAEEDGLALETEDDDLQIVDENANAEDAGLALETESDDLQILDENADADLLRGDEAPQAEEDSASVFGLEQDDADALAGASDDDLLHLGSDSGLSLLGDDAEDFALEGVELQNDAAFAPDADDDDSIFELADESKPAAVVELEQNADSDTATILGTGAEDFQLASDESTTYEVSESESASQSIEIAAEDDPFFTKDDDSASFAGFETSGDDANPFGGASDENPFASAVETPGDAFGGFGGNDDAGFGASSFDSPSADAGFGGDAEAAPVAARAPQTEYTGKDFLFLVPCFVFVLLATIGAYELCRTIWSYEEATFDISGPILDMIANAVGLTK
ncbi:MAG: helix-turn-helix domain-containing protein [Thermoguttaceae bacterium]|nr:helix-turn-helix domain-containing protein [Thermoguttaceae bacterium]